MKKGYLLLLSLLCSLNVQADDLAAQIAHLIKKEKFSGQSIEVQVQIRTPANRLPSCKAPQLALLSSTQVGGNITVSARCDTERRFIQTQVQLFGRYLVAARNIRAGSRLSHADLSQKSGRIDTLPAQVLIDEKKAIGAESLRDISAGRPVTSSMLRRPWVIKANQEVQVKAQGSGFYINGVGKAMNNAAVNENVRVRMASGQIVNGIAEEDGFIRIML